MAQQQPVSAQQVSLPMRDRADVAMKEFIASWVSSNLGLPRVDSLPSIQFVHYALIAEMNLGRASQPIEQALVSELVDDDSLPLSYRLMSHYDSGSKIIFLPANWKPYDPSHFSLFVREMTRHIQNVADVGRDCPQIRAGVAYSAQRKWLSDHGRSLEREFGIAPEMVNIMSQCLPLP